MNITYLSSITFNCDFVLITTSHKSVHSLKANCPIVVTLSGIVILTRPLLSKELVGNVIKFVFDSNSTFFKFAQFLNALFKSVV